MSVLPQLTFSRGCQLPPAAPSSLFEEEENVFSCGAAAPACSPRSTGWNRKHISKSSSDPKARAEAAGLRGMKAAEETLQWLAVRVLQQTPPPHMLRLGAVFDRMLRLDAAAASHALLQITRNIAKVFQASRFLFVGSCTACQQYLAQRLEEEKQRAGREEQEQQEALERQVEEREWQQGNNEKAEKRWDGEETVDSWEQHIDAGKSKEKSEEDDEDIDGDWSCVPLRDEQSSCFPWLLPGAAVTTKVEVRAKDILGQSSTASCMKRDSHSEERTNEDTVNDDDLFVLLQPISPAEEAFGCPEVLIKLCNFLSVQDVISIGRVCRATVAAALSEDVWMPLLRRTFPKASLVNEDVLENAEEQQRIDQEKHKQIVDDILVRVTPDKPVRLSVLLLSANKTLSCERGTTATGKLHLRMDAEALLHLISCHPELFKQDAAGEEFVVQPSRLYSDWLPVNPYAIVKWGAERIRHLEQETQQLWREEQCEAGAIHSKEQQENEEAGEQHIAGNTDTEPDMVFRRELSARQAYRLWHTKLLGAEQNRERPWEYFNACSEISSATKSLVHKRGLLLPAGALLDLCERRLRFVRLEDPMTVHTLVLRTVDGIMYHIPTGCFNRRVNLLQQALCSPHLRLQRETRKRIERKLVDFMQHVRDERKFGFFACRSCGSRWRSGFTYDEIAQQCLRCGLWNKAFKSQPLLSGQEFHALQKNPAAPLRQRAHQPSALQHQRHQSNSTPQQQCEARGIVQDQQRFVRCVDQVQPQRGQPQQQQPTGGLGRESQRFDPQRQRASPQQSQPSFPLLQGPSQSNDMLHWRPCGSEQGQPQPCTEQPHTQQSRFSSCHGQAAQQRPRGEAPNRQPLRGSGQRTRVDRLGRKREDIGKELRHHPPPNADQDRQQVAHNQAQGISNRGQVIHQRDRAMRNQQQIYRNEGYQRMHRGGELIQLRDQQSKPLLCSQPRAPSEPLKQPQTTSQFLASRKSGLSHAAPEATDCGPTAWKAVEYSQTRRQPTEGYQQDFKRSELQDVERRREETDCLYRPVSNGKLSQGLQQQRVRGGIQQHQHQSQIPVRRFAERGEESPDLRADRRDPVLSAGSYESRSELVRRVLQQQLRTAAHQDRL